MSVEVKAHIATELAKIEQLVPFPEAPFGYGSDISGVTDLDPTMAEIGGQTTLIIAQSIVRRLDCPRGENPDVPDYGLGLRQFLNTPNSSEDINALGGQIRSELLKDDRIESLIIIVDPTNAGKNLRISLQIVPVNRDLGTFTLTLNASSAEILIEEINSER